MPQRLLPRTKTVWIFLLGVVAHVPLGVLLITSPEIHTVGVLMGLSDLVTNTTYLGLVLIAASVLALRGAWLPAGSRWFGPCIIPQQSLLLANAGGAIWLTVQRATHPLVLATILNHLHIQPHDATVLKAAFGHIISTSQDWPSLVAGQMFIIATAICHSGAVWQHYRRRDEEA